jgi:FkbM family methyltransferase
MLGLQLKKLFPSFILSFLRRLRVSVYEIIDMPKPFLNSIRYLGYDLFYSKGYGLVNRIRFGNPDRIYEREMSEQIAIELKKSAAPNFLDIGANIGLISLYVLHAVPNSQVFAFEPAPHQYELFRTTIFANRIENRVDLQKKALGKEDGTVSFFIHDPINSAGDGLVDTGRAGEAEKVTVPVEKLDTWWTGKGKPQIPVVKIDTEGAELWVLSGGEKFISEVRPVIFFEMTPLNLQSYPYGAKEILEWFFTRGYDVFSLAGDTSTKENISTFQDSEDTYVARPQKN